MAINLLRLARFVDGERPSAEKFNKLFSYIENKLSILNSTIGDSVNNGVTSIVDTNTQTTFDIKINNIWGISKFLAENVNHGRTRHSDIMSIVKSIGSMSNLNPLTLGGVSRIQETIPAGVNEYVFKYPVMITNPIQDSLEFSINPIWLDKNAIVEEDGQLLNNGQWKLWKFFQIDGENNTTIKYAKSMVWYTTSTTSLNIKYDTNSENWGGGANYQGSSFNVIPDFNTPKTASNAGEFFYNLKFTNNGGDDTTVELPYVLYQQTAHSTNELGTALLNEGDINFKKRLKLPKYLKDYQSTLNPETTEFPLPKGFLTLVDFSESSFTILDALTYTYVNEHTFKVTGLGNTILSCVTADPDDGAYKQLFLLVNGTDITRSINDLQIKQSKHSHDGTFGESLIHIKDITGIFEKTDRNVYFPSARGGHIAVQYLHRDGYRYNNDPQNYDNAMMGDLLIKGDENKSYKLFFGEEVSFINNVDHARDFFPGYISNLFTADNKFSWIGLSSAISPATNNTFNIQGSEDSHVSILSNQDLNLVSKDKFVSIIKNVNTLPESAKILNSSYNWNNLKNEASAQIQTEALNANINQTQVSLVNNNNNIDLLNFTNLSPQIRLENQNKDIEESFSVDQFGNSIGLNSIYLISKSSGFTVNPEAFSSDKNLMQFYSEGTDREIFQIKENYYANKTINAQKDFFKKFIPSYYKEYSTSSFYPELSIQNGSLENTRINEVNNSTKKKEGCFVYVIQHLVDDRDNPVFIWNNDFAPTEDNLNPTILPQDILIQNRLHKKTVFNKTFDAVRKEKILNKNTAYVNPQDLYFRWFGNLNLFNPNSNTGVMQRTYFNESSSIYEESYVPILHTNKLGGGMHYNNIGFSGPYDSSYISSFQLSNMRRLYKYNPFPSSKEYINQHFYIYNITPTSSGDTYFNRSTLEVLTKYESLESDLSYDLSFKLSKVLTKIIWKKFWLKENINSNSFDFEELFLNSSESFNNDKYILVNQGFLLDCAIPPSNSQSIETYNWNLSGDNEEIARENNYNRVCEFYEVDKDSDFYKDYPNWIAGKDFEIEEILKDINENIVTDREKALSVEINGGLPFLQHGNLQSSEDFTSFFNYFKKHKFEDDNNILYFGKGFVNFYEMNGDYSSELNYDIIIDNHWGTSPAKELNRTLNIEIEDSESEDRNYKSKQNIKIIFSDFNGENLNLINEILTEENQETPLHDSFLFKGTGGPASSVTQYLWKIWREEKDWNDYPSYRNEIFKYNLDSKLYNSHVWLYGVILNIDNNSQYSSNFTEEFKLFNDLSLNNLISADIQTGTIYTNQSNSLSWNKHLNFLNSYPFKNQVNLFGLSVLNNSTHFFSHVKPRTFFTFINVKFDKNAYDIYYRRKLNNQINLKTNASNSMFNNSNNLTICLKNTSETEFQGIPIKYYNIGPIQGFYNIEIDRFTNNERSYWSVTDKLLLNEKFGCSLFDIKVNVDLNFCFVC